MKVGRGGGVLCCLGLDDSELDGSVLLDVLVLDDRVKSLLCKGPRPGFDFVSRTDGCDPNMFFFLLFYFVIV